MKKKKTSRYEYNTEEYLKTEITKILLHVYFFLKISNNNYLPNYELNNFKINYSHYSIL